MQHNSSRYIGAAALVLCAVLAACGGGGSTILSPSPSTAPTVKPSPTTTPTTSTQSVPVSPAATTAPLPAVAGYAPSVSLPPSNASSNASINATTTTVAPSTLPLLQSAARRSESALQSGTSSLTAYLFESFTPSATITFNGIPGFTLTLPSTVSTQGQAFYIALLAPGTTQWQLAAEGPAQVSGQTLTFPEQPGTQVTLNAGQTSWFAFYSVPAVQPTTAPTTQPTTAPTTQPTTAPTTQPTTAPTTQPTTAPTTAPQSTIVLSPSSLSFLDTNATDTQTFSVSESGYTGPFTVPSSCVNNGTTIATIAAGTQPNSYLVSPVAAGSCLAVVGDANGNSANLNITVTTTTIGGQ